MTEHDDKQVASVDAMANAEPSKGRRRLVKGAMLAMPAVMTLRSGAALAASSSKCQVNINNANPNPPKLKAPNKLDNWLRAQVPFRQYTSNDNLNVKEKFYQYGGNWFELDSGNLANDRVAQLDSLLGVDAGQYSLTEPEKHALAYVDNNGVIVGVANSNSGFVTTKSCYASFPVFPV